MNWKRFFLFYDDVVEVRPHHSIKLTRQEDEDTLRELRWREGVQRNIQRRRALKLLQGGKP
jgi:hypothetical protein